MTAAAAYPPGPAALSAGADWWACRLRVESAEPRVLRWVHQHLACTLTATAAGPGAPEVTVTAVAGPAAHRPAPTGPARRVEGFPGEWWDLTTTDGAQHWRRDTRSGPVAIARHDRSRWSVSAGPPDLTALTALRVLREVLRSRLAELGGLPVHAALAGGAGLPGMLLVGPAGAGKTTLALAAAARGGWVVSTDETTLVPAARGGVVGVGSPVAHRLGAAAGHALSAWPSLPDAPVLRRGSRTPGPAATKVWLTAVEAEVLLGAASAPAAAADAVVLLRPGQQLQVRRTGWHQVSAAHAVRAEYRPAAAGSWLTGTPAAEPGRGAAALDRLTRRLPLVELCWDPTRHAVDLVLDQLRVATRPGGPGVHQ